ncbi:DNA excision repair protein ERCC-8-like [Heracleum sosnowskyi]|uniref:DNA excision repair protein ERCC-8-like n=1 Tax=Heracleum sosnowskyi TaxID=360622 RepID=A0AAD8I5T3_9APIA|nr:DNA excision repair protein ERCC-8-like [Heracleum sosnowskyi]
MALTLFVLLVVCWIGCARKRKLGLPEDDDVDASKEQNVGEEKVVKNVVKIRGSDSRLRLWDVESCCNTLVNFDIVRLQTSKTMQLAVSPDSKLVFVPCMSTVKAFSMWSGQTILSFRSHYDNVNSCWYNEQDQV